MTACKRSCCWTPFGVCAQRDANGKPSCSCHVFYGSEEHERWLLERDLLKAAGDAHRITGNTRKTRS